MPKAIWNDTVIADSPDTIVVEGNHYFPAEAVAPQHLKPSGTHTTCGWKGMASYYHVVAGAQVNEDAAWYYPDPLPELGAIAGLVSFYNELVDIVVDGEPGDGPPVEIAFSRNLPCRPG